MKTVKYCPVFLMAALAILQLSGATSTTPVALPNDAREFLNAHNEARGAVGVARLSWSNKLANATRQLVLHQRNEMGCRFAKSTEYGTNQYRSWGTTIPPRRVVEGWIKQKNYYNHTDNSCLPNHDCGVYKQVVWKKSLELGCAQASCANSRISLTICFYNPAGNIEGESPY